MTNDGPHLVTSVRDLGSTNGTFVNGERITSTRLDEGDEITIGRTHAVFRPVSGDAYVSELTYTIIRLGLLALLWVFVLSLAAVLRRDIYGTRISRRGLRDRRAPPRRRPAPRSRPARQRPVPPRPPPHPRNRSVAVANRSASSSPTAR